jgi:pilus assembly protein CpaE
MPARILVVTGDDTLQRLLTESLRSAGHDVTSTADGPEGLKRWAADRPDLMVVDVALGSFDGYTLVGRIRGAEAGASHVPVIMLGAASDAAAKVRGLRAGADDYQTKPIHPAEFAARVRSLVGRFGVRQRPAPTPTRGQVHAYYGAKGGVGTTTIAINAAIAMHRNLKRRVCLLDANLQFGDHRVFLDLGPDRRSIVDAVMTGGFDADLLRTLVVPHDSGIDVLLAPPAPEAAEHVSAERHHLAQVVETLRSMYDYVVVDLPQHLDDHTLDVIGASDALFVVMTADLSCIKNVRLVLHTLAQLGVPDDKVQLVMNRSNAFTGISVKSVEGVLRRRVDHQIVNDYRAAISALNSGAPVMFGRPDSLIGRSLMEFVRAVDGNPAPEPRMPQRQLLPALT